jgi:hypothetical protein
MPLTEKGEKIMSSMQKQYGEEKGEKVFYASANKGRIKGVHGKSKKRGIAGEIERREESRERGGHKH